MIIGLSRIVGRLKGAIGVPYVFGANSIMDHLNTMYDHAHGTPFVYPSLADDVVLTAGAGAWGAGGDIIEVIPAGTLTDEFDIHWINVNDIFENAKLEIWIYKGASGSEVKISGTRPSRNAVQSQEGARRVQIPQQAAGERISCKLFSSVAGETTCGVSVEGHYYT